MTRISLYFAALFYVAIVSQAHAASCAKDLGGSKDGAIATYAKEVIRTRGGRFLVKPEDGTEERPSFYGFARTEPIEETTRPWRDWLTLKPVSFWLGQKLTGQERTRVTPVSGVWNNLINRPTQWVTRIFTPENYRPTFIAKLPMIFVLGFLSQTYIVQPLTNHALDQRVESQVQLGQAEYDDLIQNDFRFRSIKSELERKVIDRTSAERSAYMLSQAYSKYYQYRDSKQGQFSDDENMKMLKYYLFEHLKPAMTSEISIPSGYVANAEYRKNISPEQRSNLFKETHALYLKYQLAQVYGESLKPGADKAPDWFAPFLASMHQDPFIAQVTEAFAKGRISESQLVAYLMENYFWDARIQGWKTLGLNKLNPATGSPVVLEDYQSDMLSEISRL